MMPATELTDQHDFIADRVIGQDGGGLAALEDLALDRAAHPALIERMAKEIAGDPEIALERHGALDEFGLLGGQRN